MHVKINLDSAAAEEHEDSLASCLLFLTTQTGIVFVTFLIQLNCQVKFFFVVFFLV